MTQHVTINDKYELDEGRVFVTGTQALVRLPMLQRERDAALGKNTAAYISGYRGSPLGGYDSQLWHAAKYLKEHHIVFNPGVNEDLAATALVGTQQVGLYPGAKYDGVFGIWYGKGPGVDRSMDALRHANIVGTSPWGGVLAAFGDDHGLVSSSIAHQSEFDFQSAAIPILHPSTVREYFDYGLMGIALSRFSGLWVGFKCTSEVVESSANADLLAAGPTILRPDFPFPPDGPHARLNDPFLAGERRLMTVKLPAALAFSRANHLDRNVFGAERPRFGIVTVGKSYADVRQALVDLGLSESKCRDIGLAIYKVGMPWPLEPVNLKAFAEGLTEIFVVEEKRAFVEPQVKEILYNLPGDRRPRLAGKTDEAGAELLTSVAELGVDEIAVAIAGRLTPFYADDPMRERVSLIRSRAKPSALLVPIHQRPPYFCSGCPHNTSTKVPEGSRANAGIGCHGLALYMDRSTTTMSQMGGEGAAWLGQAPFTNEGHIFQNLGEGTYFHSGLLAIRAAVAAGVNITYKILFNDAVAMTGGQPVDGPLTVPDLALQMIGENVARVVVVADEPEKYSPSSFKIPVDVHHRDELDHIQRQLRDTPGCTILIYDQTCAAEKRRRRKRGTYPDPDKRAFINEAVCEGCGDCSVKSNCVSVEPVETELGRKRRINQHSCNKDFSCVNGFCPSFVTVSGAKIRRVSSAAAASDIEHFADLPAPQPASLDQPWNVLITGIGGTGVVTIGAILGMAAHVEGLGVTVLDNMGMAQKNGAVTSHVRIARELADLHAVRIAPGATDLLLGCDLVVCVSPAVTARLQAGTTHAVVNTAVVPTAEFQKNNDVVFKTAEMQQLLRLTCGHNATEFVDAAALATALMGDAIATNMFMLGYALQRGLLPVSLDAIERAIEINGTTVKANKQALAWGRLAAHDPRAVETVVGTVVDLPARRRGPQSLDEIIEHRGRHLTAYQDAGLAERYRGLVARVRAAEAEKAPGCSGLAEAVARYAAKLMAYKDEYEVARLYTDGGFLNKLKGEFEGDVRLTFHMAPPLIAKRDPNTGELKKQEFGPWMMSAFKLLARLKGLRGTPLDLFGYTAERRMERRLVADYFVLMDELCAALTPANHAAAVRLASLPEDIRGYGHVKERNIEKVQAVLPGLLAEFRGGGRHAVAAE